MLISKIPYKSKELSQIDEEGCNLQDYMKLSDEVQILKNLLNEKEQYISDLEQSFSNQIQLLETELAEIDNKDAKMQEQDKDIQKLNQIICELEQQINLFVPSKVKTLGGMSLESSHISPYQQLESDFEEAKKYIESLQSDISKLQSINEELTLENEELKTLNQNNVQSLSSEIDKLHKIIENKSCKESKLLRELDDIDKYKKSLELEQENNSKLKVQISALQNNLTSNEDLLIKASKYDNLCFEHDHTKRELINLKKLYLNVEKSNANLLSENLKYRKQGNHEPVKVEPDYSSADLTEMISDLKIIIEKIDDCDFVEQEYNCINSKRKIKLSEYDKEGNTPIKLVKFDYIKLYNNSKKALTNIKNLLIDVIEKRGLNSNKSQGLHELY